MMEICTALRRVLGTLVKRGPWVMDGQLLLGTMPALDKHTDVRTHHIDLHMLTIRYVCTNTYITCMNNSQQISLSNK